MIYCEDCAIIAFNTTIEEHVEEHHSAPPPAHHDNMPDWIQDNITNDEEEIERIMMEQREPTPPRKDKPNGETMLIEQSLIEIVPGDVLCGAAVVYLPTFLGNLRITSINPETWWVSTGGRSWSRTPDSTVLLEVEELGE